MLNAIDLKCEYLKDPIGIGELKPRFSWLVVSDETNIKQASYRLQVSMEKNNFDSPIWDSGLVISDASIQIVYDGPKLISRTRYYFRAIITDNKGNESPWSDICFFETGILTSSEWKADFISAVNENSPDNSAGTILRKTFEVAKAISSARIYATSLGLYELTLNGTRVGDALLTPGWTSYNKRLQYQTYDITSMLNSGENALGAMLGCGWFKGELAWNDMRNIYGKRTALLLQLHIEYTDGTQQTVLTDDSWKVNSSPILMSELYHGETYDARLEIAAWNMPAFDDSSWDSAIKMEWNKDILVAQENVPVRKINEIKPIEMFTTPKGETVLDLGQNMVGWLRFNVSGAAGSKVVLRHAEILDSNGNFYTENLRTAKQTIEYILKGDGIECFEPHFTFQGYRYVMLEEYPGQPELGNFTGVVIHSDMEQIGDFSCSNEMINQLQHNILWGLKGNFVDVPTDCPQRNERLGWTGDAQAFSNTACYIMNTAPFFTKWLRDLAADQLENGGVPFVIPDVLKSVLAPTENSSSGWGDAAVICVWSIYLAYGDTKILVDQYSSMKAWVEYIRATAENGLLWNSGFHYGDWLGLDSKEGSYTGSTSKDLIATAYYAYSTELFAKMSNILATKTGFNQYKEDAKNYAELYKNIVNAFRKEFYTPSGRLAVPTQTGHVLSLMFNLVEEKDRDRTVNDLVKLIEESNWHLTTGFLGTPYLCHVLSSNGRADVAYKLLLQTDYPSWLYPITKGATTIWEHWDGLKPDGTFWSADMNSFNHYAYGAIGEWLYRVVAGINIDESAPGYKNIILKPLPGGGLTHASSSINSMYGKVHCSWCIESENIKIEVEIPHNTTAELTLPYSHLKELIDTKVIDLSSKVIETSDGVTVQLGSGKYSFSYKADLVQM
jgi:alpha-L-rhamnosidase